MKYKSKRRRLRRQPTSSTIPPLIPPDFIDSPRLSISSSSNCICLYLSLCSNPDPNMLPLTPLRRPRSSIHRLHVRLFSQPVDSSPSSLAIFEASHSDQSKNPNFAYFLKWVSGIAFFGSSLGYLYYSDSAFDSLKKSASSFGEWAKTTKESITDKNPKFLFGEAYRRKIFFNYEKRIRMRSPPEKVFEYFASFITPDGETLMRPADLMRAVVPVFPPSESHLVRDGYLRGERSPGDLRCDPSEFFMLFDMNSDGLISFKEYIFFVTLLSIPETSFSVVFKMFDIDHSGEIDKEEFKKVMSLMRAHNRQGAHHRNGFRFGLKSAGSVENGGLLEYFFGKDGKAKLQQEKFLQFMRGLHDELLRLEFDHYDYKVRGSISAKDFALSMVASADLSHLNRLLDRVEELNNKPSLSEIRITFEEFKSFAELRRSLRPFALALSSYGEVNGLLTKTDFQRAASNVCGISLGDSMVEIIFHVFDVDHDGHLSSEELVRVLQKRERDIAQPMESGIMGFFSCCYNRSNYDSIFGLLS